MNNTSIAYLLKLALDKKLNSDISKHHKNNLRYAFVHFMDFLGKEGGLLPINKEHRRYDPVLNERMDNGV